MIGSCVGPAPYPALVRDLQRRIGDEARAQLLDQAGRLPDRAIACVGGGSNAIGTFIPFVDDEEVELIGVEAAGEGLTTRRHSAPLTTGARGVLHGALTGVIQDEEGQILEAHSISAGLDYPGVGPEHAWLRDSGRVRYEAVEDGAALEAFHRVAELEGILPALESSHAIAWVLANPVARAQPDHAVGPRGQGPGRGAGARMSIARRRFSENGKRAALMPYLMGGYPSIEGSVSAGLAAADAGADLLELGIPFSDPLADGPVIHAAGTEALAAGATPHGVLGVCEQLAVRVPVVLMVYANIVLTAGVHAFALKAAAAGASGLIVPDLPHDEAGELRAACDAEGLALVPLVAPTTTPERIAEIGADARGFVYTVSLTGTTGERKRAAAGPGGDGQPRARRHRGAGGGRVRHLHAGARPLRGRDRRRGDRGKPRGARSRRGRARGGRGSWWPEFAGRP